MMLMRVYNMLFALMWVHNISREMLLNLTSIEDNDKHCTIVGMISSGSGNSISSDCVPASDFSHTVLQYCHVSSTTTLPIRVRAYYTFNINCSVAECGRALTIIIYRLGYNIMSTGYRPISLISIENVVTLCDIRNNDDFESSGFTSSLVCTDCESDNTVVCWPRKQFIKVDRTQNTIYNKKKIEIR